MQPDQTTVWGSLAVSNPVGMGIPFIDPSTFQPTLDYVGGVLNLKYDTDYQFLYAKNGFKSDYTIAGASGNVTINKAMGVVQFAAAAQTLTLTNSMIKDADSIIFLQLLTDDATAKSVVVTPAAGSAIIKLNAAATGICKVAFEVKRNSEV